MAIFRNLRACPAVPCEIDANHSTAYFTGVAPEDLSAFEGWYWGQIRILILEIL